VPGRVVGYHSSAFHNLAVLHRGRVDLHVLELPPASIRPSWGDFVDDVYAALEENSHIVVHRPASLRSDGA
jgi:hypothetical protein